MSQPQSNLEEKGSTRIFKNDFSSRTGRLVFKSTAPKLFGRYNETTGSEILYFGDNDLLLPQFRPGGKDSKNRSERFSENKKILLHFR